MGNLRSGVRLDLKYHELALSNMHRLGVYENVYMKFSLRFRMV